MKRWRLEDSKGRTLKIIEAEYSAAADVFGFKNFPGKYAHAVNLEVEEAKAEAGLVELRESYKVKFLRESASSLQT